MKVTVCVKRVLSTSARVKIAGDGLGTGDFVMVAGYPGRTNRYRLADEVYSAFEWSYPNRGKAYRMWLDTIDVAPLVNLSGNFLNTDPHICGDINR